MELDVPWIFHDVWTFVPRAVLIFVLFPVPLVSAKSARKDGVAFLARPSEGIIALHHGFVVIFIGYIGIAQASSIVAFLVILVYFIHPPVSRLVRSTC